MTVTHEIALPQNRRIAFLTQVAPALAYAGFVFYAGLIRMGALPEVGFVATDKLLHTLVFGGLAVLLARSLHWLKPALSVGGKLALGAIGSSLLGFLLELCQALVPYRSSDVWDWVADTLGAVLATGLAFLIWRYWWKARGEH